MAEKKEQDKNISNLEQKKESDLTKKEKRLLEKEKLKNLSFKKRLEYIWMYDKPVIFGVILAVILLFVGMDVYENAKKETILSITVVNAGDFDAAAMSRQVKEVLGASGKYEQVDLGVNLMTGEDEGTFDYYTQMSYITQLQTQTLDVMIMPEELFHTLEESDVFADLHEILGEEVYQSFGDAIDTNHILFEGQELKDSLGVSYEPLCIAVLVNTKHEENAAKWIASLVNS